jgi:hypothetical protein
LTIDPLQDDELDIELESQAFSNEHFKRMLKKTFTDYHPGTFNLENIDIEAYMRVVEQQELCAKYGSLLEGNDKNVLTIKNMPWFDLGDLPVSYKPKEVEAF